jgi:hypothetical protein
MQTATTTVHHGTTGLPLWVLLGVFAEAGFSIYQLTRAVRGQEVWYWWGGYVTFRRFPISYCVMVAIYGLGSLGLPIVLLVLLLISPPLTL